MVTTSQELRHSTNKPMKLAVDYLVDERLLCCSMTTRPCYIDRFGRKYNKAFLKDPLFGAYLIYIIHRIVQVFLHFFNMTKKEDVQLGSLPEFKYLNKRIERGEWLTTTPIWVERTSPKEEGQKIRKEAETVHSKGLEGGILFKIAEST